MKKKNVALVALVMSIFLSCSTQTGLDNAKKDGFSILKGKQVGIVTNHTGVNVEGKHIVDLIYDAGMTIKSIYAPEHGFRGNVERGVYIESNIDSATGATVYSIYGSTRKPTPEMLEGLDVLVFDIQDIGARFYTYISTMGMIMEAAAENNIPLYIFDRPNPIGRLAEGAILQDEFRSFIGLYEIPTRHGMTVGELALLIKDKGWINEADKLDLHIVKLTNWKKGQPYEKANMPWISPSPNIKNLNEALVYPGTCLFEGTNFSEGRGTDHPFEWIGAAYIDAEKVIEELSKRNIKGVEMKAIRYTPKDIPGTAMDPKFEDVECQGIALTVTDPVHFRSLEFGVHCLDVLSTLYPNDFSISRPEALGNLWGNDTLRAMLTKGEPADKIIESYKKELNEFLRDSKKYLLY